MLSIQLIEFMILTCCRKYMKMSSASKVILNEFQSWYAHLIIISASYQNDGKEISNKISKQAVKIIFFLTILSIQKSTQKIVVRFFFKLKSSAIT